MEDKKIVRARYRSRHPEKARISRTASRYKMSPRNLEILEFLSTTCAICGDEGVKLVVDHCHDTNKVRGLLCYRCNTLLGQARDDISILLSAVIYLSNGGVMDGIPQFRDLDGLI